MRENLDIDEVVARNRFPEINHVEVAQDLPAVGKDLESMEWAVPFSRAEAFDLCPMDRLIDQYTKLLEDFFKGLKIRNGRLLSHRHVNNSQNILQADL